MLLEAGLALASELSLPAVLQRIVELAVQVTGARYGALGVLGPGRQISEFHTTGISLEQRNAIGHIPVGRGVLGALIEEAQLLRLDAGIPIVQMWDVDYDEAGRTLQAAEDLYAADRHEFAYEWSEGDISS